MTPARDQRLPAGPQCHRPTDRHVDFFVPNPAQPRCGGHRLTESPGVGCIETARATGSGGVRPQPLNV
jgi:hypothetical protein